MNKCMFIGNLTKDPELTKTPNDVSVARFTIAVSRRFTNADGERETDFITCVVWRAQAENLAKYCHKGDKISIVGSLQIRSYETNDGSKRTVSEIVVDEVEFITPKRSSENGQRKPTLQACDDDTDIPF